MSRDLHAALTQWLSESPRQMGQVLIRTTAAGYELRHVEDAEIETLAPAEARAVALQNEAGQYRPLKTAPDLRRGWRIVVRTVAELRDALDQLYPAMAGVLLDFQRAQLQPVPLRATLARQSGMYAVTKKLTDEQAQALIARVCRSDGGCLKTILWQSAAAAPITSLPASKFDPALQQAAPRVAPPLPLLCHEACNLLVAKAREVVKGPTHPPV